MTSYNHLWHQVKVWRTISSRRLERA